MTTITMADVFKVMEEHQFDRNAALFKQLYTANGFEDSDMYQSYIQFVRDNTETWYRKTVPSFRSESSASKQKTIMNNLMNPAKYPSLACLVSEADKTVISSRMFSTLKSLVDKGHFTPRPRKVDRKSVKSSDDSDDDTCCSIEEGSSDEGCSNHQATDYDVLSGPPVHKQVRALEAQLAQSKRMMLHLLDCFPEEQCNMKSFTKMLIETFL